MDDQRPPGGTAGLSARARREALRLRAVMAMADAVEEHGYANTTVSDVLMRAGMSSRTFYEVFDNREQCFLAAYDRARSSALARMGRDCNPQETWSDAVQAILAGLLGYMASHPELARLLVVEPAAAGPAGLERHERTMRAITERLVSSRASAGDDGLRLRCEATVGAVHRILHARLVDGRAGELPELAPELTTVVRELAAAGRAA